MDFNTPLNADANKYIHEILRPDAGTCTITKSFKTPGFANTGIIGCGALTINNIKFTCRCSDEYPEDTFTIKLFDPALKESEEL